MNDPKGLTKFATEYLTCEGACAVGVATTETLAGGPPSTDLSYVLLGAKSAITFALPLDQKKIERFLSKRDQPRTKPTTSTPTSSRPVSRSASPPISTSMDILRPALLNAVAASWPRPVIDGGFYHPAMPGQRTINFTCGNCQLLCHPDRAERKRRYKRLTKSGVVIQHPDGKLEAVGPEIAGQHLGAMSSEQRACYEDTATQRSPEAPGTVSFSDDRLPEPQQGAMESAPPTGGA